MQKIRALADAIKLEHTIFALPFALASLLLLVEKLPSPREFFLIILAVFFARTAGMAFNRWLDYDIDKKNPRTQNWAHIKGELPLGWLKILALLSSLAFIGVSYLLGKLAFILSPIVVFLLWFYPLAKRVTYFPHFVLGIVYFLIPIAVDVALNQRISPLAVVLGLAMATWVAGFDILYALQDYEFDKTHGVKSLPVKLGIENSLRVARFLHFLTFLFLLSVGYLHPKMGVIYFAGLTAIAGFLVYEHSLIKPNDLSKINKAFFTVNGWVSVVYFLIVLTDYLTS
ncbi:MAG: 4-hydroxybenzoate octaprenyltransferase [Aquificaceae bacterium]|nr:MAG: 4-hydroxybenzoate octaprenyltransferase [Aquificaceae bacterium]